MNKVAVCFICMGNICRSPTAEGVFRHLVEKHRLENRVTIDSAGTHGYHAGASPDPRAAKVAAGRGYDLSCIRARRLEPGDFRSFDYLLTMDHENLAYLKAIRPSDGKGQAKLFMEFSKRFSEREVPDPYYGGVRGFERVLDMVEDAAQGLLAHIMKEHLIGIDEDSSAGATKA